MEIPALIAAIRGSVAPAALAAFDEYAEEARVVRAWLDPELRLLPAGARILEVGAGMMLASCQLASEGFAVTALEPVAEGFPMMAGLQRQVLGYAAAQGFAPRVLPIRAEALDAQGEFDFAYSANVMEHVDDVAATLERVMAALKPGAAYRFNCPNYRFPYEPHFDFPTLGTKALTERVFAGRIAASTMEDAAGLWRSLNWIDVGAIRRACRAIGAEATFHKELTVRAFERAVEDPHFASRRSALIRAVVRPLVRLRLHRLAALAPAAILPLIDCRVTRPARRGA